MPASKREAYAARVLEALDTPGTYADLEQRTGLTTTQLMDVIPMLRDSGDIYHTTKPGGRVGKAGHRNIYHRSKKQ